MRARLRVGLAGAGMVSGFHLPAWCKLREEVEIVAIADPDIARANAKAAEFGISKTFPNLESMLDACQLDAVDIMTPPSMHAAHCESACAAGVHILCQKPLTPTSREAVALCSQLGDRVRLMVHENWRFRPHYRVLHKWLSQGKIGNLVCGKIDVRSSGLVPDVSGDIPALKRQPLLAGLPRLMVSEVLVHHLDIAMWLTGVDRVSDAELRFEVPQVKGESAARIDLASTNQIKVIVHGDMADVSALPVLRDQVSLIGERGCIDLKGNVLRLSSRESLEHVFSLESDYSMSYAAAIAHFVHALKSNAEFETTPQWHLRV